MRKYLAISVLLIGVHCAIAHASVSTDINIDKQRPLTVSPLPIPPPGLAIKSAPRFIFSPALGLYVSVRIPYDIVYIGNSYYLFSSGYWYSSTNFEGPWIVVGPRWLPVGLRKFSVEKIRHYRDLEFRNYERDREHYRGRWYTPETRTKKESRQEKRAEQRKERSAEFREREIDRLKNDIWTVGH